MKYRIFLKGSGEWITNFAVDNVTGLQTSLNGQTVIVYTYVYI